MPVMGGEEALPLLHEINPDTPVILASGYDEKGVSRRFCGPKPEVSCRSRHGTAACICRGGGLEATVTTVGIDDE